ncbi:lipoyltransferase [Cutaneotrichosporon oleaginosum]|uniref:lipoyl(octanoyl) transferase n=1 Tax=Cutaneotrichosporon oleaginosum TaxID=879819 RepID=A0A0J0XQP5_9TREE|nr:lipoyltransferase [Cutaneotrichosporon oleaginosum]KLT43406.1 lipoyltransferase [Cutaneotrichosporon oleaginosum]TXT05380.1 hypothetical protein COLE_06700 [Cutaneotrichosporon oleaginosum]
MRTTLPLRLSRTLAPRLLAPAQACPGTSSKTVPQKDAALPPVRYHVFRTPLPYPQGLELQHRVIEGRLQRRERGESSAQDVMFLLEHTPTYTTGRRDNSPNPDTLHPEEEKVQDVGAGFYITKRGGQVTYHGPGQIVGYPILDLTAMGTPTRCYVEYLQSLLREYAEDLGLPVVAPHEDGHVGVFHGRDEKLASIGIHLRHRITSHGFAMNITPEPVPWFDLVTACGLTDVRAVSVAQLLERQGKRGPSVADCADALVPRFAKTFGREFVPLDAEGGGDELRAIREIVADVTEQAETAQREAGGWPTRPRVKAQ